LWARSVRDRDRFPTPPGPGAADGTERKPEASMFKTIGVTAGVAVVVFMIMYALAARKHLTFLEP
jgi:hypothetical protein